MPALDPIYIVDPFGTTRDYDEAFYRSIEEKRPAVRLLTTRFNDRRHVTDATGEAFFLRLTHALHRRFPGVPLPVMKALGAAEYLVDMLRLARLAARRRSTLHFQWLPFPVLAVPLLRSARARARVILTAHDTMHHDAQHRDRLSRGDQRRYLIADTIVVHSEAIRDQLASLAPSLAGRISVIPHGLTFEDRPALDRRRAREDLGLPVDGTLIAFIGLVRPHKGLGDLMQAWRRLTPTDGASPPYLVIAGEWRMDEWREQAGPEYARIRQQADGDPQIILRSGYLPEADFLRFLNAVDLIVLPYRHASQSGVALAALRYNVPMIVTDTGALPDLMPGELRRWVVPPGAPDRLSAAIEAFLRLDAPAVQQLRDALHDAAGAYSWSAIADRYVALYDGPEIAGTQPAG